VCVKSAIVTYFFCLSVAVAERLGTLHGTPITWPRWNVGAEVDYTATGMAVTVYTPANSNEYYYNLGANLYAYSNTIYYAWIAHPWRESGSGLHIRYSTSTDMGGTVRHGLNILPADIQVARLSSAVLQQPGLGSTHGLHREIQCCPCVAGRVQPGRARLRNLWDGLERRNVDSQDGREYCSGL